MTLEFTYDIADTSDISSRIRLEIGDNRINDGILPNGGNFTDSELDYFYSAEGDDFQLALARAFDAAAARWASFPDDVHLGPEFQTFSASKFYAQKAYDIRTKQQRPGSYAVDKAEIATETD